MSEGKRRLVMKWGGYGLQAGERVNKFFGRVIGKRGIYYLLTIAALGLILGAGAKWHG